MNQIEKIEINRNIADEKNKVLMQVLYRTLEATRNQVTCYGDCENCVLGSKKENECLGGDISTLKTKISKLIEIQRLED